MNLKRLEKFRQVANRRQPDLTVILENVTDMHNIGAVLRSCDSVGLREIYVLNTEPHLQTDYIVAGKRTSMGTRKWVDVHYFIDPEKCFERVRKNCHRVLAAWLGEGAKGLHELDWTQPTALLFGNEHSGISEPVLKLTDGSFVIPQVGMAESLNISVACAVTLYEVYRQRKAAGFYDEKLPMPPEERAALFEEYVRRHEQRSSGKKRVRVSR